MPRKSLEARAIDMALKYVPASKTLLPGPSFAQIPAPSARTALRRCCAAWQRAFDAFMHHGKQKGQGLDKFYASREAGEAYRNAMPLLVGFDGVRDFIACISHGILIGAIPQEKSGHLLYAAQVALAAAQRGAKSVSKPAQAANPHPLPPENPPVSEPVSHGTPIEIAS